MNQSVNDELFGKIDADASFIETSLPLRVDPDSVRFLIDTAPRAILTTGVLEFAKRLYSLIRDNEMALRQFVEVELRSSVNEEQRELDEPELSREEFYHALSNPLVHVHCDSNVVPFAEITYDAAFLEGMEQWVWITLDEHLNMKYAYIN